MIKNHYPPLNMPLPLNVKYPWQGELYALYIHPCEMALYIAEGEHYTPLLWWGFKEPWRGILPTPAPCEMAFYIADGEHYTPLRPAVVGF